MDLPEAVRMDDTHRMFLSLRLQSSIAQSALARRGQRGPYKKPAPPSQAPCRAWDERFEFLSDPEF